MRAAENASPLTTAEANGLFAAFAKESTIVVAVSGGPDSTALLWLASRLRASRKMGPKILAVTIDHGLRPESRREANTVKRFSRGLGVTHRTLRWTGAKPKAGIQEAARAARYSLLAAEAKKAGARHVLTGHTLDDQAETLLLRFLRGSGPAGLQAMTELSPCPGEPSIMLARPLLSVPKARLVATLTKTGIAFADDPSNRDPRHTRPRLRALMPSLADEGLTPQRLATLAKRMQRAEAALRAQVAQASEQVSLTPMNGTGREGARIVFDCERFLRLPAEIALRLLGQAIDHVGDEGPVELGKLEALFETLARPSGESAFRRTLAGALVTRQPVELIVERAPPRRGGTEKRARRRISALTTLETGVHASIRDR